MGEVLGTITLAAPTRSIYDEVVAELLVATALTTHYGADSSFSGNAPGILFFGSANVTGDSITFGNVGSTLMAGPEAHR